MASGFHSWLKLISWENSKKQKNEAMMTVTSLSKIPHEMLSSFLLIMAHSRIFHWFSGIYNRGKQYLEEIYLVYNNSELLISMSNELWLEIIIKVKISLKNNIW